MDDLTSVWGVAYVDSSRDRDQAEWRVVHTAAAFNLLSNVAGAGESDRFPARRGQVFRPESGRASVPGSVQALARAPVWDRELEQALVPESQRVSALELGRESARAWEPGLGQESEPVLVRAWELESGKALVRVSNPEWEQASVPVLGLGSATEWESELATHIRS